MRLTALCIGLATAAACAAQASWATTDPGAQIIVPVHISDRQIVMWTPAGRTSIPRGVEATYYALRAAEGVIPREADWHELMTPEMAAGAILHTV